jgi:hypothetical protein
VFFASGIDTVQHGSSLFLSGSGARHNRVPDDGSGDNGYGQGIEVFTKRQSKEEAHDEHPKNPLRFAVHGNLAFRCSLFASPRKASS